jgi:hypothetical protein
MDISETIAISEWSLWVWKVERASCLNPTLMTGNRKLDLVEMESGC